MRREKDIDYVVPEDWFTESVMWQMAGCHSLKEFLIASGTGVKTFEEFNNLPDVAARDAFVAKRTGHFSTWEEMCQYARDKYFGFI